MVADCEPSFPAPLGPSWLLREVKCWVKEAARLGWEGGEFQVIGPGGRSLPPHPICGAHTGLIVGTEDPGQGLGWSTRLLIKPRSRKGLLLARWGPQSSPATISFTPTQGSAVQGLCSLLQEGAKVQRGEG